MTNIHPNKSEIVLRAILLRGGQVRNVDLAKELDMGQANVRVIADMLESRGFIRVKRRIEKTETAILPSRIVYYELRPQKRARAIELIKEVFGSTEGISDVSE